MNIHILHKTVKVSDITLEYFIPMCYKRTNSSIDYLYPNPQSSTDFISSFCCPGNVYKINFFIVSTYDCVALVTHCFLESMIWILF